MLFTTIPLIVVIVLTFLMVRASVFDTANELLVTETQRTARISSAFLRTLEYTVDVLSDLPNIQQYAEHSHDPNHNGHVQSVNERNPFDSEDCFGRQGAQINKMLNVQVDHSSWIEGIIIVDKSDMVVFASVPTLVGTHANVKALSGDEVEGDGFRPMLVEPGQLTNLPWSESKILAIKKIPNSADAQIILFCNTSFFDTLILNSHTKYGHIALFDRSANLITSSNSRFEYEASGAPSRSEMMDSIKALARKPGASMDSTFRFLDSSYNTHFESLPETGWVMGGFLSIGIIQQDLINSFIILILVIILVLALCYALAAYAAQRYVSPIEEIIMPTVFSVASGGHEDTIAYDRDDEFGVLSRVFNEMAGKLNESKRELNTAELRHRMIAEGRNDIVFDWDSESDKLVVDPLFQKRFGFMMDTTHTSESIFDAPFVHPEDREAHNRFWRSVFTHSETARESIRIRKLNGEYVWVEARAIAMYDEYEQFTGVIGVLSDIDAAKREELRLTEQVLFDALSGVYSRSAFEEKARTSLLELGGFDGQSRGITNAYMLFGDIDDFKDFNTTYGHGFGDRVIRFVGTTLKEVVGEDGFVGRVGGDEFTIFLNLRRSQRTVQDIIDQIDEKLAEGLSGRVGEETKYVTVSLGVAKYGANQSDYETLMQRADAQMYATKRRNKEERIIERLAMLEEEGTQEAT